MRLGLGQGLLLSCAALLALTTSAAAASRDFVIRWSSNGAASATGSMTIDDAVFLNPGINDSSSIPWVTAFSITITGASSGNGTFSLADFSNVTLQTNGGTLDLDRPLLGQNNGGLFDPVGMNGMGGDFNLFGAMPAPSGSNFGEIRTDGGSGDALFVTRISPVLPVPLPAEDQKCMDAVGKGGGKYLAARHGALVRCYSALLADKPLFEDPGKTVPITDAADCPDELKTAAKIDRAQRSLRLGIEKKCSDAILDGLQACAATVDGLVDPTGAAGCLVQGIDARVADTLLDEYGL